jgi:hypothetical protein
MLNLLPALSRRRAVAALTRCCLALTLLCSLLLPGGSTAGSPVPTANSPVGIESHPLIRSSSADTPGTPAAARVAEAMRSSPVMFIENVGQFAEGARFQVRGGNGTMWIAEDAIWITVLEQTNPSPQPLPEAERGAPPSLAGKGAGGLGRHGVNLKLTFPGANPHPRLEPFDRLDTHVSYFIGNDPAKWHPDVPVWGGVRYVGFYPGIDLEITSENGRLVQRLVARPGANLSAVRLRVEGAESLALEGESLLVETAAGEFRLPLLRAEGEDGSPLSLTGRAATLAEQDVLFPLTGMAAPEQTDPSIPADDPSDLLYSTFLGGSDVDSGSSLAVDGSGNAYVTGITYSSDFPTTPGAFDTAINSNVDAFVTKLNAAGSGLLYSTFLGGNSQEDVYSLAVDGSGNAYVTGGTYSIDFPTTPGAFEDRKSVV